MVKLSLMIDFFLIALPKLGAVEVLAQVSPRGPQAASVSNLVKNC